MIAVDSNVLLRYFVHDDDDQTRLARTLINGFRSDAPGYIPLVVLAEVTWVMSRGYKLSKDSTIELLEFLLSARELVIENRNVVNLALATYRSTSADFSDALIAHSAHLAGCSETVTFDRLASIHAGMRLLK